MSNFKDLATDWATLVCWTTHPSVGYITKTGEVGLWDVVVEGGTCRSEQDNLMESLKKCLPTWEIWWEVAIPMGWSRIRCRSAYNVRARKCDAVLI